MRLRVFATCFAAICTLLVSTSAAQARTKLVTLPERDLAHLRLEHDQFVLVEEERIVTLHQGHNEIDFSWQNVTIDAASIQFRALTDPDKVSVLSVSYPPEGNSLVWQVDSVKTGAERIRISYLIAGMARELAYRAVVDQDERFLTLRTYLKLKNQSGERFEHVHVAAGYGREFDTSLDAGEAREVLSYVLERVPVRKTFTYDQARTGDAVRLHYVIPNERSVGLGTFAVRPGKARLFQADRVGSTAFLGEDWVQSTPVGEEVKLYVGDSRDVVVKRHKMSERRLNERRNRHGRVVAYDLEERYKLEIENFRPAPVDLTVVEHLSDYWEITEHSHPFEVEDSETVEFTVPVPAEGEKTTLEFTVLRRNLQ